jgi:hypothetical protein
MAEAPPAEFQKWGTLIERMLITTYYRVLSFTSLHAPIGEIYTACKYMSENTEFAGNVYWLIEPRVFIWENVVVNRNPDYPVAMIVRVFGSPIRGVNTVFMRAGWMFMYTTGPTVDRVLGWFGDLWKRWTGWR